MCERSIDRPPRCGLKGAMVLDSVSLLLLKQGKSFRSFGYRTMERLFTVIPHRTPKFRPEPSSFRGGIVNAFCTGHLPLSNGQNRLG